ncbi:hypothetical protein G5C65_28405, partial [Streptomyces sp. SB3404]|nr:hypothetical protein [Streptomyces boncukensis]
MTGGLARQPPEARTAAAYAAHRMLWWAREGDVLVLPTLPDDALADYITGLTGTPRA